MADSRTFRDLQYEFARHIRDPDGHPPPSGVEDRRMAIYRDLFFNNLRNLLSQTFPVLRRLHSRERWAALIREFMARHVSQTPYFLEIPQEFLAWLQDEYVLKKDDFPFLLELAHYEWVELALSVSDAENDLSGIDPAGDLLDGVPVKSVLAWSFAYRYPVHRITTDYLPTEPGPEPVFLAVCRKADDSMDFMELNPVTARLLERIEENESETGRALLTGLATEAGFADVDTFVDHGRTAMERMRTAEIIVGVK